MPDESTPATSRCPWCSTSVPAGTEVCPSCGAALIASGDGGVPGLTAIDAEAVLRNRSQPKSRGGLLGFLSGETGDTVDAPSESELASLAPPDANVRMEMLRLEIEAERQRLEDEGLEGAALSLRDRDNYALLMRVAMLSSLQAADTTTNLGFRCVRDGANGP